MKDNLNYTVNKTVEFYKNKGRKLFQFSILFSVISLFLTAFFAMKIAKYIRVFNSSSFEELNNARSVLNFIYKLNLTQFLIINLGLFSIYILSSKRNGLKKYSLKSFLKSITKKTWSNYILLIILTIWPTKGKPIFERLFNVKSSYFVLQFLDEKTSLKEELSMFYKLQIGIFIKSIFYWFYWKFKKLLFPILMIAYILLDDSIASNELLNLSSNNLAVLTFGLLIIGIPHGALDHLTEILSKKNTINFKFIFYYLLMMVPILLIWFWVPTLGLVFFLIYSAWHFGQT